jgi:hypothetical protein
MIPTARLVAALVVLVAVFMGGMRTMAAMRDARDNEARIVAMQEAEKQRAKQAAEVAAARTAREQEIRDINARLAGALVRLRKRPERMPEPARQACTGATGAELSGPDSEVLTRLAARADEQQSALSECYKWIDTVKDK